MSSFRGFAWGWNAHFTHEVLGEGKPSDSEYRMRATPRRGMRGCMAGSPAGIRRADGAVGGCAASSEDITERRRAEAALRESKELLQLFIEHAPAALAMFDREMRYLAVSRRWLEDDSTQDRRRSSAVLTTRSFPDLPESWRDAARARSGGEVMQPAKSIGHRADGSQQWLRRRAPAVVRGRWRVGGIIIFAEDITERKRAEAALRESKELLQLFIEQAPVALAMFDSEMRYLAVSRQLARKSVT